MDESKVVWGEGPYSTNIMLLGMCPGPEEMSQGRPFVGGSGRVLDFTLQKAGLARSACYITNIVKHYVPPGRSLPKDLLFQDRWMLDKELAMLSQLEIIVTLGQEPFTALTGKVLHTQHNRKSAEKDSRYWLRGCPYLWEVNGRKYWILPTIHPSFVMRTGFKEEPIFEVDLTRARRFHLGARPPEEHYNYNATDQEILEYTKECYNKGVFGCDIETPESNIDEEELDPTYVKPIDLVGLSCNIGEAIGAASDQLDLVKPLFEGKFGSNKPTCWTFNGGNFDFYHLSRRMSLGGIRQADAMLGMHLLWSDLRNKDLATCLSLFCDIPYYKNTRKLNPQFYNTVGNCRDTYGALWAGESILREMKRYPGMEKLFWDHMMALCPLINDIRIRGVNTDQVMANRIYLALDKTLQAYEEWWDKNIPMYSWSSPKQLIDLFRGMGLPIFQRKRVKKDKEGNKIRTQSETMDDEALEEYIKRGNKTAGLILKMRELRHAKDFVSLAKEDGRIHPRLKLHGQAGGRIQAVDGNVQQLPEEIANIYPRAIIIPDEPKKQFIFSADYSQIELRLYAIQSKAVKLLERFASGDYIYGIFYESIFKKEFFTPNKPHTKANKLPSVQPWEILVVKSWPLGFIYGRGLPDTTGLPISSADARTVRDGFYQENPQILTFHHQLEYTVSRNGYLITPFGRIRRFPNVRASHNEILSFPGQVTGVDVLIGNALRPLPEKLKQYNGRIEFSVHDSIMGCADIDHIEEVYALVKATMEAPIPELDGWSLPIELKVGSDWQHTSSLEKYLAERRAS